MTNGHPRHDDVIVHRSGIVLPSDIRHVDGLRVAAPALTIVGLAGCIAEEELEIAFESARRLCHVTVEEVAARLEPIVALECDGRSRHSEDSDFHRDRARWSAFAGAGWRIVFATWRDVTHDWERVERQLRSALDVAA